MYGDNVPPGAETTAAAAPTAATKRAVGMVASGPDVLPNPVVPDQQWYALVVIERDGIGRQ
jgi:hypothetical protein